jgi:hypothetical protein
MNTDNNEGKLPQEGKRPANGLKAAFLRAMFIQE